MSIISNITALQTAIVNRLLADSFFTGSASPVGKSIPVIAHQPGKIQALSQEEAEKISLAVVVMVPTSKRPWPASNPVPNTTVLLPIKVLVSENGAVNNGPQGAQVASTDVIGRIIELLHYWNPGLVPNATKESWLFMDSEPWTLASSKDPMLPQYFVNFFTYLNVKTLTD